MNTGEIDRIAAAINMLRPDWPVASLRTLLGSPELVNRPRRDVAVALAWVACESTSVTPARVKEAGPWWRAAAVDGVTHVPGNPTPQSACWTCGRALHQPDQLCDQPETRAQALAKKGSRR